MRVIITKNAKRDVAQTLAWWRENAGADEPASKALKHEVERLVNTPGIGSSALDVAVSGVRRRHVQKLRSFLYYRVELDRQVLTILALWHTSRGSPPKL